MELKLVYRALRKISDWTLAFYSEVHIDGQENVPEDGPLILVASHHNEIIDIATLAVTIPHGRPICYWAKSTMFKNPLLRAIMLSSGSISVRRNPNNVQPTANGDANGDAAKEIRQALFRGTIQALEAGEVVGVFPEGTSYTEPRIAQVKDGASWAALEYIQWQYEQASGQTVAGKGDKLIIVPVGIVYTDKSQYQSRVCVRWGEPIELDTFAIQFLSGGKEDCREAVKKLSGEIERRLLALTINAPSRDIWYAARVARDLVWQDETNIPLKDFVPISQRYIDRLTDPTLDSSLSQISKPLLKYQSLLHHTNIEHASLAAILPAAMLPTRLQVITIFLRELVMTVLHPRALLFLPPLLIHFPAYVVGRIAERIFATPGEEETRAQFKAVGGGIAFGVASALVGTRLSNAIVAGLAGGYKSTGNSVVDRHVQNIFLLIGGGSGLLSGLGRRLMMLGVIYGTTWILSRWHSSLVKGNYKQYKRLVTSFKLLLGCIFPRSPDLAPPELELYSRLPPAKVNPHVTRSDVGHSVHSNGGTVHVNGNGSGGTQQNPAESKMPPKVPRVPSRALVRHLLAARMEAESAVRVLLSREQS